MKTSGFRVTKEIWDETGATPVRTMGEKVELHEGVSAVPWPAYEDTAIALRSLEAARAEGGAAHNAAAARRRVAEKRAIMEQRIRGIRQEAS